MYTQQTMYIFYIWYICWYTIVFMLRVKNEKRKTKNDSRDTKTKYS